MKNIRHIILIVLATALFAFKTDKPCGETPELNKNVLAFVKANLKKQVATGECWDLAAGALDAAGAKWDGNYKFGKEVDHKKTCVFPGDIVQFEGVELQYTIDDAFYIEKLLHHTAVIYEVKGKGDFIIADQNTKTAGKKVSTHAFNVATVTKGKFTIFRPEK